jgi:hypothetical protein
VFVDWFKIIDQRAQFYANIGDYQGNVEHAFEIFYREKGIVHMFTTAKHPQVNEKMGR